MRTVAGKTDHVVVVGAGLAGLSAALHLAGRGRTVTVVERDPVPGGRAGRRDVDGYRLDTGPSVLTMPDIVGDTLAAVGEQLGDRLELQPLVPAYRACFADGSMLDVHHDAEAMEQAIAEFAGPVEVAGYRRLRAWLSEIYRVELERFIAANFDSPLSLVTPALARLVALGGFRRLDAVIGQFLTDPRLRRVFTFQSLYAGVSPQRALALYAVIAYMDTVGGVYFPRGGMRALPDALAAAARDAGVDLRYSHTVTELEQRHGRITAIHTTCGQRITCDAVVIATELDTAYELLDRRPRRPLRLRPAPSAVVLHAGMPTGAATAHHSILFGEAWAGTFDEIIDRGELMSDPSLLITRPTSTDPALAPAGRDLYYVLAPVPNLDLGPHLGWDHSGYGYGRKLAGVVDSRLVPGFAEHADIVHLATPADWARQGMLAGTPFSLAHTFSQTGPFRPANLPRRVSNAVLAGCGTVPGVGVPTALLSGRLAADRITGAVAPGTGTTIAWTGGTRS
ncbi:phytoene desaturase family protein [Nocardia cyriacigeorgica]|uniref:phytoene desaturase family protein n=1 Tax=Nocardia cyriacigeorgica TaxID=135487 RepID=UPI001894A6D6|nr:phytoene desaturase family protein [Nocardia cyriacigeorgica]MBF6454717.1 phytoene desaturase [Nocardia cyriacigeorgica]MBF6481533.1 phytoene desaturase [Nocardia cyriacigeorgica]MBF6552611.1 phytoene desaturase [Nocardia cyriacigeorgica]